MKKLYTALLLLCSLSAISQIPVISSFTPLSGPAGTVVTITGTNFNTTASRNIVWLGGMRCTITSASATSLTVTVPEYAEWDFFHYTNTGTTNSCYSSRKFLITFTSARGYDYTPGTFLLTGSFPAQGTMNTNVPNNKYFIGDINNDRLPDVVIPSGFNNLTFNTGNMGGGSTQRNVTFTSTSSQNIGSMSAADWDGDGDLDYMVAVPGYAGSGFLKNNGLSNGNPVLGNLVATGSSYTFSPNPVDFNNDGKIDVMGLYGVQDQIYALENTNTNIANDLSFAAANKSNSKSASWEVGRVADLDRDGKMDLVIGGGYNNALLFTARNTTTANATAANFTYTVSNGVAISGNRTRELKVADLDGDGKDDIILGNISNATVNVFPNLSTSGTITLGTRLDIVAAQFGVVTGLAIGDLNNDSKPDIVLSTSGISGLVMLKNTSTGAGNFSFEVVPLTASGHNLIDLHVRDMNGDGALDILGIYPGENSVRLYKNTIQSPPTFYPTTGFTNLAQLSNWTANPNGSSGGYNPPDFGSEKVFVLANRTFYEVNGDATITGKLTLSEDYPLTVYNGTLTLTEMPDFTSTSYISTGPNGRFRFLVPNGTATTFPVGRSAYNPLVITNNSGAADYFSVNVADGVYPNGVSGIAQTTMVVRRTWDINKETANGGAGVDFEFNWNEGEAATLVDPLVWHHNGRGWVKAEGTSVSGTNKMTLTGYTGTFSPFSVMSFNSPLPLTWGDFTGKLKDDKVLLEWSTLAESNTRDFLVEYRAEGRDWALAGTVAAAGQSNTVKRYAFVHADPVAGNNTYRLRQRDLDNNSSLSKEIIVSVKSTGRNADKVTTIATGGLLTLTIQQTGPVTVFNSQGALVLKQQLSAGTHQLSVGHLSKGIYQCVVAGKAYRVLIP
ncbi:MAG: FG-GAP-like repeat-containing protein [Pseudobacter sp.]|uniref:FG-GAP-like repeat-containing protein n=1 Tax=Pseudobacter sp. TaxID=2045420 RepID=UPI003F7D4DD9